MPAFLRRLFHIYPGEEKSAFLFAALGFVWSLAITSGLKFADALFLIHVGADSLPIVYMWTACGMVILASFLIYAFNVFDISKIFLGVVTAGFLFYVFAFFCLQNNLGIETKWLWFALRICGSLLFTVFITCYWTFIDQYHSMQDAKRLYSLFCAMVFLGVATTGLIMRSGLIDFQQLTVMICTLLMCVAYGILLIVRKVLPVNEETEAFDSQPQPGNQLGSILRQVLQSRFTLLLMVGNFITYLLLVITEYNYMLSFDNHFDPGIVEPSGGEQNYSLTQFLGECLAFVSISNFIFGLFFYSRLIRRFGIGSMLFITPTILLLAFSGWSMSSSLVFPVIGLFVVEGTLYVIDDSNFNLLLNAVPSKLKYKIRLAIESFFEPVGMLISSLLLSIAWIDSRLLGLLLASCALVVAYFVRKNYPKAIYANLADNSIHFQRSLQDWFRRMPQKEQKQSHFFLLATLRQGELKDQRQAYAAIQAMGDATITEKAQRTLSFFPLRKQEQITAIPKLAAHREIQDGQSLLETIQSAPDNETRLIAIKTLELPRDGAFIQPLIESSIHFRPNERRLIESILVAGGYSLKGLLLNILKNPQQHDRTRTLVGRVLGQMDAEDLRKQLPHLISQEIERAHFYFFHAHTIKKTHPELDLHLLADTLMTGYHSVMDFIIQLLGSAGEVDDCELLTRSLRSRNPKVRSQVVETLERSCENPIFKLLYPLVSETPREEKINAYYKQGRQPLELFHLLDHMCHSPSQLDRIVACAIKFHYQTDDWRPALQQLLQSKEDIIKHFAQELLQT